MPGNPHLNMQLKPGAPAAAISRRNIQYMHDAIKYLSVRNGRLIIDGNRITIECGGTSGSGTYNGIAYAPDGTKTTGLTDTTKPWVKYRMDTGAITQEIGPPASPWGANEIWRLKADFGGAIYF
jgi:hypothetical protein